MSPELELRHARLVQKLAQLEHLLRERHQALAASRAAQARVAEALAAARAALIREQRRQATLRAAYAQAEARAWNRVKGDPR